MKFSSTGTPSSFTPPPPKPKNYFLSQPHQPFFLFGVVWAIVSMVFFTLSHKGVVSLFVAENIFHLYTLAFIVFIQFFHGFLFTTFPRFSMSEAISKENYIPIVFLYQIFAALFFVGSLLSIGLILIAIMGIFIAHLLSLRTLMNSYRNGRSPLKSDPFWLLVAHSAGIIAHLLFIVSIALESLGSSINLFFIASPITVNLFLIFLTFVAAQRMIPFFSHSNEVRPEKFVARVFTLFIIKTVLAVLSVHLGEALVSLFLSLYLFREILHWKLPLFHSSAILWILYLALFWLPVGLFLGSLIQMIEFFSNTSWLFSGIHLLMLGFTTTVLIGFGTRVTLGHSGQPPHADKLTIALFWWTQIIVLARLALSVDTAIGASHGWLFDAAGFAWILLFIVWSLRYGKTLVYGKKIS